MSAISFTTQASAQLGAGELIWWAKHISDEKLSLPSPSVDGYWRLLQRIEQEAKAFASSTYICTYAY